MRQGDQDWWRLADTISTEDRPRALEHNAHASPQHRLELALGPVPCAGAIMTAPVVVLLSHPLLDAQSTPDDYSFRRAGWPLAALHPEAPRGIENASARCVTPDDVARVLPYRSSLACDDAHLLRSQSGPERGWYTKVTDQRWYTRVTVQSY